MPSERPHCHDTYSVEVSALLQLLHNALALPVAWNPSNNVRCLRYAVVGAIHAQ